VSSSLPPATSVPSPCVSVCRMDEPSGLCVGCWRTLDEIACWATLGDEAKRQIWQRIEQRQQAIPAFTTSGTP
jgi:uncharacterized protein